MILPCLLVYVQLTSQAEASVQLLLWACLLTVPSKNSKDEQEESLPCPQAILDIPIFTRSLGRHSVHWSWSSLWGVSLCYKSNPYYQGKKQKNHSTFSLTKQSTIPSNQLKAETFIKIQKIVLSYFPFFKDHRRGIRGSYQSFGLKRIGEFKTYK